MSLNNQVEKPELKSNNNLKSIKNEKSNKNEKNNSFNSANGNCSSRL